MDSLVLEAVQNECVPILRGTLDVPGPVEDRDMQAGTEKVTVLLRLIGVAVAPSKPSTQRPEKTISLFDVLSHMN